MSTYSFLTFSCSISGPNGSFSLSDGNASGGITFDRAGPKNTKTIGADGTGMNSLHADNSGTITIRVLKTSPVNAMLQSMYDADKADPSVWGQNVIKGRDTNLGDDHTATQCAFQKFPTIVNDVEGAANDWVFDACNLDSILGSNI